MHPFIIFYTTGACLPKCDCFNLRGCALQVCKCILFLLLEEKELHGFPVRCPLINIHCTVITAMNKTVIEKNGCILEVHYLKCLLHWRISFLSSTSF